MTLLIIIQLILALLLVILILLQGSDNEGLGLTGGGGGLGGLMTPRGSANLLTRLTAITAALFMIMSVILTITATAGSQKNILKSLPNVNSDKDTISEPSIPESN